jgi:hypothetical protein
MEYQEVRLRKEELMATPNADSKIKPSYQNLGEICDRLSCGPDRIKRLISEGLPAAKIAGQYMMTEKKYLEWLERQTENTCQGEI